MIIIGQDPLPHWCWFVCVCVCVCVRVCVCVSPHLTTSEEDAAFALPSPINNWCVRVVLDVREYL